MDFDFLCCLDFYNRDEIVIRDKTGGKQNPIGPYPFTWV